MPGEGKAQRTWGYWTQAKLQILERYLKAFATASKGADERVYLDAFAGEGFGIDRVTGEQFQGSARIALNVADPAFTRLRYFELPERAKALQDQLQQEYPGRDIRVYGGDCNEAIPLALSDLKDVRWAPTFAFLDPDGMALRWGTLEHLADHRTGNHKVELWMLFPTGGLLRTLTLRGEPSEADLARATRLFGSDQWQAIFAARRQGLIEGAQARAGYLNLMRWRLESVLGYAQTHPLEIRNLQGVPIYDMIFATDHSAGTAIMSHLYARAADEIPAMRQATRDQKAGVLRLFDLGEVEASPGYTYEKPISPDAFL
ncbi:MAG TPA: three-Cys-motif partner protein TcmP [Actinomycetota bacterium]|nr:three-Cys-motif partner protein TcmP [Actinomycetota bacterium]